MTTMVMNDTATNTGDPLAGRRLLILGLARQGKALARFAVGRGATVVISDLRSAEALASDVVDIADLPIELLLGAHPESLLDGVDLLAISGSVPADAPFVNAARARGIAVTNDSAEFLRRAPGPTIGITGSAGKSTTTSLTGAMGAASGRTTWVGGNIGRPLITEVDKMTADDIVVQELSSFQLEIWDQSPAIAAILNVTPNHLDRHRTMDVYREAKANILRFQNSADIAVLPARASQPLNDVVQGRLRQFSRHAPVSDGAYVQDNMIWLRDQVRERAICGVNDIQLLGAHNIDNVLAAVTLADCLGVPVAAMRAAIRTFTGIEHRLEAVATIEGVVYVNDSIATAPERAVAAINAFNEPLVLMLGGRDKDLDWEPLLALIEQRVKHVVLFGEIGRMLAERLSTANTRCDDLAAAVNAAQAAATAGDIVLLAPGGTSFDAYQDFAARGAHFRQLVREL